MNTIPLYRYTRANGGTTVTPIKPAREGYTTLYRLIADEGKELTKNDVDFFLCVDVESVDGWREVEQRA